MGFKPKYYKENIKVITMERIILLSYIFLSNKSLFKEVRQTKEEEDNETLRGFQEEGSCSETYRRFQEGEEDP